MLIYGTRPVDCLPLPSHPHFIMRAGKAHYEEDVVSFGKNPNLKLPVKENATLSYVENDPTELETPRGQKEYKKFEEKEMLIQEQLKTENLLEN